MKAPLAANAAENKLQYIDSLRGIAILMVIVNHAGWYLRDLNKYVQLLSDYGQMGVQLFFVVSAFTLCLSMYRRSGEGESLVTFYLRRYFRIAPLYYIGIPLYFCYHSFVVPYIETGAFKISSWYTIEDVLINIFLVNDFFPGNANTRIVAGGWSIGTETTFYVIFPLIFLLYKKYKDSDAALYIIPLAGLLASLSGLYLLEFLATDVMHYQNFYYLRYGSSFLYNNIICQLPVFLVGMSLFFGVQRLKKTKLRDRWSSFFSFVAFTCFAFIVNSSFKGAISLLPFLPAISFCFLFILFREVKWLNSNWLARIGQLSYSIYLFHFVFAFEGSRFLNEWLQAYLAAEAIFLLNIVITTVLAAGVAVLSEKWIEKPGIELGKRIINKVKQRKPAARLVVEG